MIWVLFVLSENQSMGPMPNLPNKKKKSIQNAFMSMLRGISMRRQNWMILHTYMYLPRAGAKAEQEVATEATAIAA
jgi:hypothetical protein